MYTINGYCSVWLLCFEAICYNVIYIIEGMRGNRQTATRCTKVQQLQNYSISKTACLASIHGKYCIKYVFVRRQGAFWLLLTPSLCSFYITVSSGFSLRPAAGIFNQKSSLQGLLFQEGIQRSEGEVDMCSVFILLFPISLFDFPKNLSGILCENLR